MHKELKLGKSPATEDSRDLLFATYRIGALPPYPSEFGKEALLMKNWRMLGNDQYGDCVIAGGAHETMYWSKSGQHFSDFNEAGVLSDYAAITGFNPVDGSGDNGTNVRDALRYRQKTGLIDASGKRHKILAYLNLRADLERVKEATYLFDAVGIGFLVPSYAMSQFNQGKPWSVLGGRQNIEGGHYVPVIGYWNGMIWTVTWGRLQPMTVPFFRKFCDEAWAILDDEFIGPNAKSPDGFDLATLKKDIKIV